MEEHQVVLWVMKHTGWDHERSCHAVSWMEIYHPEWWLANGAIDYKFFQSQMPVISAEWDLVRSLQVA